MKKYSIETFDNVVPEDLRLRVWDYIQHQSFHATRKDVKYPDVGSIIYYTPADGKREYMTTEAPSVNSQYMHRCVFGNDEGDLLAHPAILDLWNTINMSLGNKYAIAGDPEGIADRRLENPYARVYVNAQMDETIKRSHGIHRDTIDLDEENHYTLLYMANLEWYPTWMAENVFYCDDASTGDTQQYQKGLGQSRNFEVGYPYSIIPPKAGRVVLYDGRTLHTTKPTAPWAKEMRYAVVFRIKKVA